MGEVHPDVLENYDIDERVYIAELDFEGIVEIADLDKKYKPLPKYPAIVRDLAIVLDEDIMFRDVEGVIWTKGEGLIEKVELFDVYTGEQIPKGKKSVAFSITYRSHERTLKDEEVSQIHQNIVHEIEETFKANLRS